MKNIDKPQYLITPKEQADIFNLRHGKLDALKNVLQIIYLADNQETVDYWQKVHDYLIKKDEPKGFYNAS
jgi:hypothetical protein